MQPMTTIEEIEKWRIGKGLTRKEFSEALGCSYTGLLDVLNRKRPLSRSMSKRIEALMSNSPRGLDIVLPPTEMAKLKEIAAERNITPAELAEKIIASILGLFVK